MFELCFFKKQKGGIMLATLARTSIPHLTGQGAASLRAGTPMMGQAAQKTQRAFFARYFGDSIQRVPQEGGEGKLTFCEKNTHLVTAGLPNKLYEKGKKVVDFATDTVKYTGMWFGIYAMCDGPIMGYYDPEISVDIGLGFYVDPVLVAPAAFAGVSSAILIRLVDGLDI